jgi:hypothetical protein
VVAWRQTYYEVLEELTEAVVMPTGPELATLRAAAARTAAILIQGTEHGNSDR